MVSEAKRWEWQTSDDKNKGKPGLKNWEQIKSDGEPTVINGRLADATIQEFPDSVRLRLTTLRAGVAVDPWPNGLVGRLLRSSLNNPQLLRERVIYETGGIGFLQVKQTATGQIERFAVRYIDAGSRG